MDNLCYLRAKDGGHACDGPDGIANQEAAGNNCKKR